MEFSVILVHGSLIMLTIFHSVATLNEHLSDNDENGKRWQCIESSKKRGAELYMVVKEPIKIRNDMNHFLSNMRCYEMNSKPTHKLFDFEFQTKDGNSQQDDFKLIHSEYEICLSPLDIRALNRVKRQYKGKNEVSSMTHDSRVSRVEFVEKDKTLREKFIRMYSRVCQLSTKDLEKEAPLITITIYTEYSREEKGFILPSKDEEVELVNSEEQQSLYFPSVRQTAETQYDLYLP